MLTVLEQMDALAEALQREREISDAILAEASEALRAVASGTADGRLARLITALEAHRRGFADRLTLTHVPRLEKLRAELARSSGQPERLVSLVSRIAGDPNAPASECCARLLDVAIEMTGAERGFVALYWPDSSEVEIPAAREFESRNLSVSEYQFSRGLLRRVLSRGEPILSANAADDPVHSQHDSVRALQLRSVLALPLLDGQLPVGALYLEDRTRIERFHRADAELLLFCARIAVFQLRYSGMIASPPASSGPVFLESDRALGAIIGETKAVTDLRSEIRKMAASDATVLIEGETGTGKELVAAALHAHSKRREGPFVPVNCAAIPETLLESELFGHERGAFTGALQARRGQVEQASGGTLFLDEMSELPYAMQAKLLRFLQEHEFRRVGGSSTLKADVRVVAATSKDLRSLIAEGRFQEALFFRLLVLPLRVPPLRERKSDIPLLIEHFLTRFASRYGKRVEIAQAVLDRLQEHPFSGNVRELENLVHRLVVRCEAGRIQVSDLPSDIAAASSPRVSLAPDSIASALAGELRDLADLKARRERVRVLLERQERELIERVAKEAGGNTTEVARRLGVHRATIHKLRGRRGGGVK